MRICMHGYYDIQGFAKLCNCVNLCKVEQSSAHRNPLKSPDIPLNLSKFRMYLIYLNVPDFSSLEIACTYLNLLEIPWTWNSLKYFIYPLNLIYLLFLMYLSVPLLEIPWNLMTVTSLKFLKILWNQLKFLILFEIHCSSLKSNEIHWITLNCL